MVSGSDTPLGPGSNDDDENETTEAVTAIFSEKLNSAFCNFIEGKVKLNRDYPVNETWQLPIFIPKAHVEGFYEIIPLFNYDNCVSTNPKDKILDNVLIIQRKQGNRVSFESENNVMEYAEETMQMIMDDIIYTIHFTYDPLTGEPVPGKLTYNGNVTDKNGYYVDSQVLDPALLTLLLESDKNIIQEDEYADLTAELKDGVTPLINQTVYFYELFEPYSLRIASNKSIIQTNEYADVTGTLKDEDGSLIEGEPIYFYEKAPALLTLVSNKSILSYVDSDTATLTATLTGDDVANKPIVFKNGNTVLDTVNTDSNGVATYTYSSQGAGDVTITAEYDNLSDNVTIEDCYYWNEGSSVGSLEFGSNVSCTSNGEYITITTCTSGEKDVKIPVTLTNDWEFQTTIAELGSVNSLTFKVGSGSQWGAVKTGDNGVLVNIGSGTSTYTRTVTANDTLKITYINGTMTVYWNNDLLTSSGVTVTGKMGYYTNNGRVQKIKNIKLKSL